MRKLCIRKIARNQKEKKKHKDISITKKDRNLYENINEANK